MNAMNRRYALGSLVGLVALSAEAGEEVKPGNGHPSANPLVGKWTYRSFASNPDISTPFDKLEFWRAVLTVEETRCPGPFRGRLDGDPGEGLSLKGVIGFGNVVTVRFTGRGDQSESMDWVYDYLGYLVPAWPNGVKQRPAIIGTVIRTKPHKSGTQTAPAGVVAQWIAVKQDS